MRVLKRGCGDQPPPKIKTPGPDGFAERRCSCDPKLSETANSGVQGRHTRWIMKGKAGRPAELGVPLTIVEATSGFILSWRLHWEGGDTDAAVPVIEDALQHHPTLTSCSFDRGYHSPSIQRELNELLSQVILPVKGNGTRANRAREATPEFQAARQRHPGVESAIHGLECHGLARVRVRGKARFERTVAMSILATNLHRLGHLLQVLNDTETAGETTAKLPGSSGAF